MNGHIFQIVPLVDQSFMQKLLKQFPLENAVIELNNLLATKPIKEIDKQAIYEIQARYKINLIKEFRLNLEEFYAVYFNYCLDHRSLNVQEREELDHLKHILDLEHTTVEKLHTQIGSNLYHQAFKKAIANGRLLDGEKDTLEKLRSQLQLPQATVYEIEEAEKKSYVEAYLKKITANKLVSPSEESELQTICQSLNYKLKLSEDSQTKFNKYKTFWLIENSEHLPTYEVDIHLQKNEVCYYITEVDWYEERSKQGWVLIKSGTAYFTNKRIIFSNYGTDSSINYNKVFGCHIAQNGLLIEKDTIKKPILKPRKDLDVMEKMLKRILRDN